MNSVPPEDITARTLAEWYAAAEDKDALLLAPDEYPQRLIALANEAHHLGVIDVEQLRKMLELADAAHRWAVEVLLTRELNQ